MGRQRVAAPCCGSLGTLSTACPHGGRRAPSARPLDWFHFRRTRRVDRLAWPSPTLHELRNEDEPTYLILIGRKYSREHNLTRALGQYCARQGTRRHLQSSNSNRPRTDDRVDESFNRFRKGPSFARMTASAVSCGHKMTPRCLIPPSCSPPRHSHTLYYTVTTSPSSSSSDVHTPSHTTVF